MKVSCLLLMVSIPLTFAMAVAQPETSASDQRNLLVQISRVPAEMRESRGVESDPPMFSFDSFNRDRVITVVRDTVLLMATRQEFEEIRQKGLEAEILWEDDDPRVLHRRALYGPDFRLDPVYHTYDQIVAQAAVWAEQYPERITAIRIGYTQQLGRPIYAYRLSRDARQPQDLPGVLFHGSIHSSELVGTEIVFQLMRKLVLDYGKDPEITQWLDTTEVYLIPVVNVDGHDIVTSGHDPRWRKNARILNEDGIYGQFPDGVDLNRGFDFNWIFGGSGDPERMNYRGEYPFSESENRALRDLVFKKRFVLSVAFHSQGEVLFYPWIWNDRPAPDDALIRAIVSDVAASIPTMDGTGTYAMAPGGASSQTYPWFYGRMGVIDFIVEVGKGAHVFPPGEVPGLIEANMHGVHAVMRWAQGPGLSVRVTDAETGEPLGAQVWLPAIENEMVDRRHADTDFGRLWRLLLPGTYHLIISHPGYHTKVMREVVVKDGAWTPLEVSLQRE